MHDPDFDPMVFEVVHGRPVPSIPSPDRRTITARETARIFGGGEEDWRIKWEDHFEPSGGPNALFTVVAGKPVPLHRRGELPPVGQSCYTANELTGGDDNHPEWGALLNPELSYAQLLAIHAASEQARAVEVAPVVGGGPFVNVVPVARYVAQLRAAGMPPVVALYTVASIAMSDVAVALHSPDFEWPQDDADEVAEPELVHLFRRLTEVLNDQIERYTSANARRVIAGHPGRPAA